MKQRLFTIAQAAKHKGVSRTAIYNAIKEKRLKAVEVLGKPAIRESDLMMWEARPGPQKGIKRSQEVKARMSKSQKARWAKRKQDEK